jgi:hypothetical protein
MLTKDDVFQVASLLGKNDVTLGASYLHQHATQPKS